VSRGSSSVPGIAGFVEEQSSRPALLLLVPRRSVRGARSHAVSSAGRGLALGPVVIGLLTCLTIIGIPLGLANLRLLLSRSRGLEWDIVDLERARRLGYAKPSRGASRPLTTIHVTIAGEQRCFG
jgi:hypothetical protein